MKFLWLGKIAIAFNLHFFQSDVIWLMLRYASITNACAVIVSYHEMLVNLGVLPNDMVKISDSMAT